MQQHHEVALDQALDQVYLQGAASIPYEQLYLFFNADRLNKNAFREIIRHWKRLCEAYGHKEKDIPELEILHFDGAPALNIRRGIFKSDGEDLVQMANWT